MNWSELSVSPEENARLKLIVYIGLVAAILGLGMAATHGFNRKAFFPTDPPPIIIKPGSIYVESKEGFKTAGNITGNAKRRKLNEYLDPYFKTVKSVFVNRVNDVLNPEGYYIQNSEGLTIQLWIQKFDEAANNWKVSDLEGEADIVTRLTTPLRLELPEDLTKNLDHKHPRRKFKNKLDLKTAGGTTQIFRIGRIKILDRNGNIVKYLSPGGQTDAVFEARDGDEFYISLWDKI
jgi:hypothetical protein